MNKLLRKAVTMTVVAVGCAAVFGPAVVPAHAASPAQPAARVHQYNGYLTAAPASTTAPVTLTVQTRYSGQISVAVTPSTKIVRRYGALSGLDEMSANDVLDVSGTPAAPGVLTATFIRDVSIQAAYTRLVGLVTTVAPNSVSVVVQRDEQGHSPFTIGQNLSLPVGASTQVISGTIVMTGTTSLIAVNDRIVAIGVFNRTAAGFVSTFRIRVLPTQPSKPVTYLGYLTTAPMTVTAPATLTIQTRYNGQVVVTVSPSTKIVRRYGALSGLDEMSANDVLEVRGSLTAPGALTATYIRDTTIQAAYTRLVGLVTVVTPSSVSVVVQRDERGRSPFAVGENLSLPVGASTQVISGTIVMTGTTSLITVNDHIVAIGVFNRVHHAFDATFRIRVR